MPRWELNIQVPDDERPRIMSVILHFSSPILRQEQRGVREKQVSWCVFCSSSDHGCLDQRAELTPIPLR
eukprot:7231132-Heterocapsa_arctica.AAC.1